MVINKKLVFFSVVPLVCLIFGLIIGRYLGCAAQVPSKRQALGDLEYNKSEGVPKTTKDLFLLTQTRSWKKPEWLSYSRMMEGVLFAFHDQILYEGMPRSRLEDAIGEEYYECLINGQKFYCFPLEYTRESLPEVVKMSTIGTQWYLLFRFSDNEKAMDFSLKYGSPKTWRIGRGSSLVPAE